MLDRLAKLIDVKSIVTLLLVFVLCILTLKQMPTGEVFNSAVMLVLGFFFGKNVKQEEKQSNVGQNSDVITKNDV